jgi:hypothetical protein
MAVEQHIEGQTLGLQLSTMAEAELNTTVEAHLANFEKSAAVVVGNTRALLQVLRTALKQNEESREHLTECDQIWADLEHLFRYAMDLKGNIPFWLRKQKENLKLYTQSAVHETMRKSYAEIETQREKVWRPRYFRTMS